jgi:hypothetical protein
VQGRHCRDAVWQFHGADGETELTPIARRGRKGSGTTLSEAGLVDQLGGESPAHAARRGSPPGGTGSDERDVVHRSWGTGLLSSRAQRRPRTRLRSFSRRP